MSAPNFGFSSWRRPSPSAQDQREPEDIPVQSSPRPAYADPRLLSSSVNSNGFREPTRSFIPGSVRDHLCKPPLHHIPPTWLYTDNISAPVDSAEYARNVREDTAELASYVLSDKKDKRKASFLRPRASSSPHPAHDVSTTPQHDPGAIHGTAADDSIQEVSESSSPESEEDYTPPDGPSMLANMLKHSPPQIDTEVDVDDKPRMVDHRERRTRPPTRPDPRNKGSSDLSLDGPSEETPLLRAQSNGSRPIDSPASSVIADLDDIESQKPRQRWSGTYGSMRGAATERIQGVVGVLNPKTWDRKAILEETVMHPLRCLPSVIVGLLLNILDALSYGMILFPLGNPVFASLGPAGISIFYVSTIIAQLTFSCGSIFRGGVGSELIEVVPFFHSMAATITSSIGEDQPDAVIATTITAYALSTMLTGVVFYCIGKFEFGYIIGFIPRHILIGCIGGVGWFLIATGFEVSGRLESFHYDLATLRSLVQPSTLPLWIIPLALAILQCVLQKKINSQHFVSVYILMIPLIFWFFVASIDELEPNNLRHTGWIFDSPPAEEPWWHFWTLYKFHLVHWGVILETVGAMFALTFFSLLHVPINVPALAQSIGEDDANLNHELILHGYSNLLSGFAGSIQNYLVYANTLFFMRSGGNSRLAGFMLAALTATVMVIGPVVIGFIPVMMVGTLIFVLGIELLMDALIAPRRKLKRLEYLTIIAIVLTMGIYDFVAGIFLGIVLAFGSVIVNQSQVSAIRATYTGDQIGSMVRRNPSQYHFLQEVGRQTYIVKLFGNLFFGTIVGVQEKVRALIADDHFAEHPIRYLILDLWQVTGIDYSAAEGFMTLNRLLNKKGIVMLISGKDADSRVGRDLRAVGLGEGESGIEVKFMPDLNSALESCENEQLKTFYAQQEALRVTRPSPHPSLDVPETKSTPQPLEYLSQSPRRNQLHQVARTVLTQHESQRTSRWRGISEPLRLMLQIFHDISDKNEDFWFRAKPYFQRRDYKAGTVLYHRGEPANGFYLLERGELRADYETPQGKLSEPIVQGTTCGELPFFSQTDRTATVLAVRDCAVWVMDTNAWERLRREENDVYQELLMVSLKLTTERMNAMTNYTLANAN
ncbi:sulfate transporter family protein [Apiospora phragmitis]|uniref:Sulfate transporter family protein n=1 Tax=Apiospora phragmitis TaxID=2905665 RepID=A0ABR1TQP3_9PEZI